VLGEARPLVAACRGHLAGLLRRPRGSDTRFVNR